MSSIWSAPLPTAMDRDGVKQTQDILVQVCVTLMLYGMQATLFIASLSLLARKDGKAWKLVVAVTVAFTASTMGIITQILAFVTQCPLLELHPTVSPTVWLFSMYDVLLIWRAWVLWYDHRLVHGLLIACLVLGIVGVIYETASRPSQIWSDDPVLSTLIINLPLLGTNIVATTLVGIRAWLYRREVTAWISPFSTGSRIQGVLVLLFEAGAVYCAISVVNLAIDVSVSKGSPSSFVVFTSAMFLLAGIYPTLIVVAVMAQQRAAAEASMKGQSNFIGSLRFAGHYDRTAEGDVSRIRALTSEDEVSGISS